MSTSRRLRHGGLIDRARPITFKFDGRPIAAFVGDTVASALLAAGVRLVGRSFRLHRPRGVLGRGVEEPNALVHVKLGRYEEPNVRATLMPVREGLEVFSQNAWPTRHFDVGAIFDWLPRLWTAGFYHKTFMWPNWHWYEPFIRRMAGLGRVRDVSATAGVVRQRDLEVDVLVCGGGPAGVAAASAATSSGRVVLLHGGEAVETDDSSGSIAEGVDVYTRTWAVGVFGERTIVAIQEEGWGADGPRRCLLRIRARTIIVATGAIEQPLVFENNDRPGVMLASAVGHYLQRYSVRAGDRALLVTNNDHAYEALSSWQRCGIEVAGVVDSRTSASPAAQAAAEILRVPLFTGIQAFNVHGPAIVRGATVNGASGRPHHVDCDLVAMSGGWAPAVHLYSQAGGTLEYAKELHAYVPAAAPSGVFAVGAAAGVFELAQAIQHARLTGAAAAANQTPPSSPRSSMSLGPTRWPGRAHRQWLDFQHDVTVADARSAIGQGYTHVEHFKRYTTTGMAVDQGKTSLRNALEVLAEGTQQVLADLRPPTYRPPYVPLPLAAAAGPNVGNWYRAERRLPCHKYHMALDAHFDDVGGWRRPLHYGPAHAAAACIHAEVHAVRNGAGLFASSPLGKLAVSGPDALEFLDRLYVNNLRSLQPGKVRYVLMLRDNGIVMDDGTVARLDADRLLVTTTSGNAERIYLWMREWAECEWPQLKVLITPLTTAWGTVTLSGPMARAILRRAGTDLDLDPATFPHMTLQIGTVAGLPARVYRVSFTGEVSFEINVPASATGMLWQALMLAGASDGIRPYGIDALNLMRTEKGYLHIGADTDAMTTPLDLGWGSLIAKKPGDFVGRGALVLPEYQRPDRLQLVGVVPIEPGGQLLAGAHLVDDSRQRSQGFLTSACHSPTLGHAVAMARLEAGSARLGEQLLAFDQGKVTRVRIVAPAFYDPENVRLKG